MKPINEERSMRHEGLCILAWKTQPNNVWMRILKLPGSFTYTIQLNDEAKVLTHSPRATA